jgi:hypothetical protein
MNEQRNAPHMELQNVQQFVFADSCLPRTAEICSRFGKDLIRALPGANQGWPLSDRVLTWLLPFLEADVGAFHAQQGPGMTLLFAEHQLEHIDEELAAELLRRLDQLPPPDHVSGSLD